MHFLSFPFCSRNSMPSFKVSHIQLVMPLLIWKYGSPRPPVHTECPASSHALKSLFQGLVLELELGFHQIARNDFLSLGHKLLKKNKRQNRGKIRGVGWKSCQLASDDDDKLGPRVLIAPLGESWSLLLLPRLAIVVLPAPAQVTSLALPECC